MARIQNNVTAMNTHRMYTNNNKAVAKNAEKLASGYRVNRAGDDAAGLAISEKMRSQIRGLTMASKNASDAIGAIQIAEGALQEVQNMLQRMNELAVQAASDTNTTTDREALDLEVQQLMTEIDQIAETTNFNETTLLDGTFKDKVIQVGAEAGATLSITITAMNAAGLKINGNDIKTRDTASAAISVFRQAITDISTQRATLGALQNRLEHKINNLGTTIENLQAAESGIRDTDMASEMSNFTKNNILTQAATAMLAQAQALPQNVLQLLG